MRLLMTVRRTSPALSALFSVLMTTRPKPDVASTSSSAGEDDMPLEPAYSSVATFACSPSHQAAMR